MYGIVVIPWQHNARHAKSDDDKGVRYAVIVPNDECATLFIKLDEAKTYLAKHRAPKP
jgi:hypothetical protein